MMALKFSRTASETEIEDRKRSTLESLGRFEPDCDGPDASQTGRERNEDFLPEPLASYLKIIRDNPGLQATERDRKFGISLKVGSQMRKRLKAMGLLEDSFLNPGGRGRSFKDLLLSSRGQALVEEFENKWKTRGK